MLCQKKQCQHYNDTKRIDTILCQPEWCQFKDDTTRVDTKNKTDQVLYIYGSDQ